MNIIVNISSPTQSLKEMLRDHKVTYVQEEASLEDIVSKQNCDVIFLDGETGKVKHIKLLDPRAEVIFLGESESDEISAIQNGAFGFFRKDIQLERLREMLDSISALTEERREVAELERKLFTKYTFHGLVGKNPKILDIQSLIRRIAPYYKTVLITGETGTGKEVVAKSLHSASPFASRPFMTCNCGSLVENLVESELFGHTKGAFTGAISNKKGLFESAGEGTLFLDEIAELPLSFQPHFLRVLQSGEYRSVGSEEKRYAQCRIVAATNKDLSSEVETGQFREDFFYRVSQFLIHVPPLRERKDDIPLLSRYFLDRFVNKTQKKVFGISRPAQKSFMDYNWPGNVRELENVIEHAAIMTTESFIRAQDLPNQILQTLPEIYGPESMVLDDVIKNHILRVLEKCSGNKSETARLLGISRWALIRKLEKLGFK